MFDDIYDNGTKILGKVSAVINYINNNDGNEEEKEELLKDLKELYSNDIVCIDYDNPMGYTLDYWTYEDILGIEVNSERLKESK